MKLIAWLLAAAYTCSAYAAPQDWQEAGMNILEGVNRARSEGHACAGQIYPPVPALRWNAQLGAAALEHSNDMASRAKLDHAGKDGSTVVERSQRAGYNWSRIGENIAYGQWTPQAVLATWLSSPAHCANIMNRDFTEMGAAFSREAGTPSGLIYWTQVLGTPR